MDIATFIALTPEYQNLGLNILTASFFITLCFTFFLQLPGLVEQARTLWRNRSAEGVDMITFITLFSYFLISLAYMFSVYSAAGIINSLALLPPQLAILWAIFTFKKMRPADWSVAAIGLSLFGAMLFSNLKETIFALVSVLVFIGLTLQPLAMIRSKTSANVALSFPRNFTIVTFVWTIYGLAIGDWFIAGSSGAFMLVHLTTTLLWFKYRVR